jgi:hypothetical protein
MTRVHFGKLHGPDSLITMEAFHYDLPGEGSRENSLAYTNALLFTHWFTSPLNPLIGFYDRWGGRPIRVRAGVFAGPGAAFVASCPSRSLEE